VGALAEDEGGNLCERDGDGVIVRRPANPDGDDDVDLDA